MRNGDPLTDLQIIFVHHTFWGNIFFGENTFLKEGKVGRKEGRFGKKEGGFGENYDDAIFIFPRVKSFFPIQS